MPTVRCLMTDCVHWDDGYCSARRVAIDDEGLCRTFESFEEALDDKEMVWESDSDEQDDQRNVVSLDEEFADDYNDDFDDHGVIRGRRDWDEW
ncbi:MAG: DUF1540 domain-containing protein [Chloroflexota bacterium]|nr:DUF1540 domain-containing protein [Chloroflexota bacterium]